MTQEDQIKSIIDTGDAELIIEVSSELGQQLAGGLRESGALGKTQIRNIFGMVKQLQARGYNDETSRTLKLMVPKLRYAEARESKLKPLTKVLIQAIGEVDSREKFGYFVELFEAIVAYHYAATAR